MQRLRPTLLLLSTLLFSGGTFAQLPRLWGMTTSGGANNKGTLFHVDARIATQGADIGKIGFIWHGYPGGDATRVKQAAKVVRAMAYTGAIAPPTSAARAA